VKGSESTHRGAATSCAAALSSEKRSKKLLFVLASAFPDGLSPNEQKFFGSFFQKRTSSFFRVSAPPRKP
jgi:hypothetical protein